VPVPAMAARVWLILLSPHLGDESAPMVIDLHDVPEWVELALFRQNNRGTMGLGAYSSRKLPGPKCVR
jgi:hypothetical protein